MCLNVNLLFSCPFLKRYLNITIQFYWICHIGLFACTWGMTSISPMLVFVSKILKKWILWISRNVADPKWMDVSWGSFRFHPSIYIRRIKCTWEVTFPLSVRTQLFISQIPKDTRNTLKSPNCFDVNGLNILKLTESFVMSLQFSWVFVRAMNHEKPLRSRNSREY